MAFLSDTIDQNEHNSRLDKWLGRKFPQLSFKDLAKFVRKGEIKVNDKRADIALKLTEGDVVSYKQFVYNLAEAKQHNQETQAKDLKDKQNIIFDNIIFEDANILAINKPNGIAVQDGSKIKYSIASILQTINVDFRLVHRLDKETSGVLIIAKSLKIAKLLTEMFRNHDFTKTYIALCSGKMRKIQGEIHYPLLAVKHGGVERMVRDGKGLECKTLYTVVERSKGLNLIELNPITGRKHQLRAHLRELQCPILGDERYDGRKENRLMLHAARINFMIEGEVYSIISDPSDEFKQICRNFGFKLLDKNDD